MSGRLFGQRSAADRLDSLMTIVFARTDYTYDSYSDFWRLVELAGYPIVNVSDIRFDEDVTYIFTPMNGQIPAHLASDTVGDRATKRCRIVWWNLEYHSTEEHSLSKGLDAGYPLVDAVWVSDMWIAAQDPRTTHVMLGGDKRLRVAIHGAEKAFDVAHMSYIHGRREGIFADLRARGRSLAPAGWGIERAAALSASRLMLHVHQYPTPVMAPLRACLAAAYKLPMVVETLADPGIYRDTLYLAGYDDLVNEVERALRDPGLVERGERLYRLLCEDRTFRDEVERGIENTVWRQR